MVRRIYQERRDVVVSGLKAMGWPVATPKATFFVWSPTPNGRSATEIASRALQEAGVVITPGIGFGSQGEGFIRIALTVDQSRLAEAMERLKKLRL
jgi:LL-diaminopimelate aminotransferase